MATIIREWSAGDMGAGRRGRGGGGRGGRGACGAGRKFDGRGPRRRRRVK